MWVYVCGAYGSVEVPTYFQDIPHLPTFFGSAAGPRVASASWCWLSVGMSRCSESTNKRIAKGSGSV